MSDMGCTCYSSGSDGDCPKHNTRVEKKRFLHADTLVGIYCQGNGELLLKDFPRINWEAWQRVADYALTVQQAIAEDCCKLACHFCAEGTPIRKNQHVLESNISESGKFYVDCAASPIRNKYEVLK